MKRLILVVTGILTMLATPMLTQAQIGKLKFSGDFRGRYEGFRFSEDESGEKKARRSRLRYRFRINVGMQINEHMAAAARLTTGDSDNRSGNQTLGSPVDFEPSEFDLRRAYVTIYPFANGKLWGDQQGSWKIDFGRTGNPFIWRHGIDKMVWDGDIALAGVGTYFDIFTGEAVQLFAATGYYVIAESGSGKDPYMTPVQGGVVVSNDNVAFGARGTYYFYDQLNEAFMERAADDGNIQDGLTGDPMGGSLRIIEGQGFVALASSEAWPITLFGGGSVNTSAVTPESEPQLGKADKAFNGGVDLGNKKKIIRLGMGAVYIEADALVSQFIDSDYLDGVTNRKGIFAFVQRQILKSTDASAAFFLSDAIDNSLTESVKGSERFRTQIDLTVKF